METASVADELRAEAAELLAAMDEEQLRNALHRIRPKVRRRPVKGTRRPPGRPSTPAHEAIRSWFWDAVLHGRSPYMTKTDLEEVQRATGMPARIVHDTMSNLRKRSDWWTIRSALDALPEADVFFTMQEIETACLAEGA